MSPAKTMTQGGQVALHNLRMIGQVMKSTLCISFLVSFCFFGMKTFTAPNGTEKSYIVAYYASLMKLQIPMGDRSKFTQGIPTSRGKSISVKCRDIVTNPGIKKIVQNFKKQLLTTMLRSLIVFIMTFLLICFFWFMRGKAIRKKEILAGGDVIPLKKLIKLIQKDKKASELTLSGLPLIKDSETKHMLIVGTTGAGKTNTFNHLLPQIRDKQHKAIIVDTTGTFVEKFYNPKTDSLLNPLDARSHCWSLWKECQTDIQIDDFAASLIPQTLHDPFWSDAGRLLFAETFKILKRSKNPSIKSLLDYAVHKPLAKIQGFYANTPAASLVDIAADKTAASIRVSLSTHLKSLHLISDSGHNFSIREWIQDDSQKGWLFLAAMPDQRETLRPLLSTWLNSAINALMSCRPDHKRRIWFIIDEKQSLNKIEALPKALAEIRKYGGCIVSGLQNISQIDKVYGHECRKTMSSLYNTKVFFRSPDTDTAQWISRMIGEHEILENSEGISFGAHQMRDGVTINEHKKQKAIIPYSEFLILKDLDAYIKLSEDYPVTKLTFNYKNIESKNPAFIPPLKSVNEDNTEVKEEAMSESDPRAEQPLKLNILKIKAHVESKKDDLTAV
jgi:type IV conjugative transfer system coupling protein TraD